MDFRSELALILYVPFFWVGFGIITVCVCVFACSPRNLSCLVWCCIPEPLHRSITFVRSICRKAAVSGEMGCSSRLPTPAIGAKNIARKVGGMDCRPGPAPNQLRWRKLERRGGFG